MKIFKLQIFATSVLLFLNFYVSAYNNTCKIDGGCLWCQEPEYGCSKMWFDCYDLCDNCNKSSSIAPNVCNFKPGFQPCGDFWINLKNNPKFSKYESCVVELDDGCFGVIMNHNTTYKNKVYTCPAQVIEWYWFLIGVSGVILLILICCACDKCLAKYRVNLPPPKFERILTHCTNCRGGGQIQRSNGWINCPICHGHGKY